MSEEAPLTPEQNWQNAAGGASGEEAPLVLDAESKKKKRKLSIPRGFRWAGLFIFVMMLAIGVSRCMMSTESMEKMNTGKIGPHGDIDTVSPRTTEEYKQKLDAYSDQKSKEQLQKGGTFVQPVSELKPQAEADPVNAPQVRIEPVRKPEPKKPEPQAPAPKPQERRQEPVKPEPTREERIQQMQTKGSQEMISYLQTITPSNTFVGPLQTVVFNAPTPRQEHEMGTGKAGAGGGAGAGAAAEGLPTMSFTGLPNFRPGDVLYCINRVSLNSDTPGPVVVEIVSGKLRGAKAIGSFQRINEHLVLRFGQIVDKSGLSYKIDGFGIDPEQDTTAVRSSVDNHYLMRWGGLIAASFLEGFADAIGSSGSTSTTSAYGSTSRIKNYDLEDQLWMGAGKVGERAASIFQRNFGVPPTVYLKSGTELGILLLGVDRGTQVAAPAAGARNAQGAQSQSIQGQINQEMQEARQESRGREASAGTGMPGGAPYGALR